MRHWGFCMPAIRRAIDYSTFRHVTEQLLIHFYGRGWMATWAHRLGWHQPLQVVEYTLTLRTPAASCPPLRLVFASDFHAGPTTHSTVLTEACNVIRAAQPDLLLFGGDFVSLQSGYIDVLAPLLAMLPARLGHFAVLSNHDLWADDEPIRQRLVKANIPVLINQNVRLGAPFEHVWICGLDDPTAGVPNAAQAFDGATGTRIVLMHSPEGLGVLEEHRFDVALCGHTHGGQVAFPSGRPIWLPHGRFSRQYPYGWFSLGPQGERTLIVSRGIGYGGVPIRCYAWADIVVCTITWSKPSS